MAQMMLSAHSPADYALRFARSLGMEPGAGEKLNDRATALEADPAMATRVGCALLQGKMAPPPVMRAAAIAVEAARIPTLVVSGGWSPFFDLVSRTTARLTGGRFEIVPAPNHFVQDVSATAFNDLVEQFMATPR